MFCLFNCEAQQAEQEEECKQEIYRIVTAYIEDYCTISRQNQQYKYCFAEDLDAVELTNRIYEEETLRGTEFSGIEINGK